VKLPSPADFDAYRAQRDLTPDDARRDYVLLRVAEAIYREPAQHKVYVCKGAFVLHFVFDSPRTSKDIDGIADTRHDKIRVNRLRQLIQRGIADDFTIDVPRTPEKEPRQDSITFAPITFNGLEIGSGSVELELSLREELVYPAQRARIVVPEFGLDFWVTHLDLEEQAAEKMRCLAQRSKVPDAYDVWWLWERRSTLDSDRVRFASARKLPASGDHHGQAERRLAYREASWDKSQAILPHQLPSKSEVFRACRAAFRAWVA
jgi:predicted nucleotidyltransferase component of viral defense system